jgi:hypothetical protein
MPTSKGPSADAQIGKLQKQVAWLERAVLFLLRTHGQKSVDLLDLMRAHEASDPDHG